jgi:uncharacterized protein (DUF58 family)
MNRKSILLCVIIFLLFLTALIARNGGLVWMALIFTSYLGLGIFLSPVKEDIKIKALRYVNKFKKGNSAFVEVIITITNEGRNSVCFFTSDLLQEGMNITEGSLSLYTALKPGEETGYKYIFESPRGRYNWDYIRIQSSDPFGCVTTETFSGSREEIFIQPLLKKYRPFILHPWKTLSSPGNIPTQMGGSGTDFRGIRDYHPGDPLKSLDWRLTARYPHKFFTREFIQEKTTEIMIILDGRSKMEMVSGKESIFEAEVNACASLSEMFLHQGYCVGISVIAKKILRVLPNYGKKQLFRILNCLAKVRGEPDDDVRDPLYNLPLSHFSSRTLIMMLSPVDSNDIIFYRRLRSLGFQVVLISPDILDFAYAKFIHDNISRRAYRACRLEHKIDLSMISQLSISVIDWKIKDPLPSLLKKALSRQIKIKKM